MLEGPAGAIEGMLELPQLSPPAGAGVVCHPHPLHGGAMTNKVVHTLARACTDVGLAAFRFNFRGVGASSGQHDDGVGEVDDALCVVAEARRRFPGRRVIGGFSFGAIVAMNVARDDPPDLLITVAPPVTRLPPTGWRAPDCPWLIVQGDRDELVDVDAVVDWVNALPPGPELVVLGDVDHFFHGRLAQLRETATNQLRTIVNTC